MACGGGGPERVLDTGRDDGGGLGPLDEATEVKDDCESALELADEPMELTRGDAVPDEYA